MKRYLSFIKGLFFRSPEQYEILKVHEKANNLIQIYKLSNKRGGLIK